MSERKPEAEKHGTSASKDEQPPNAKPADAKPHPVDTKVQEEAAKERERSGGYD